MFKSSILIAKINSQLSIKFNLIIHSDNSLAVNKFYHSNNSIDDLFEYNGSTYYKINPTSFISLDFQEYNSNNEQYNPMRTINLNRFQTFIFIKELKRSLMEFYKYSKSETPVFWYNNNQLMMDNDIAEKIAICKQFQNKTIQMKYTIGIFDTPTGQIKVPGCILFSVSIADSCFININELEYFLHVIENINFTSTSLQLFQTTMIRKDRNENTNQKPEIRSVPRIEREIKNNINPNETLIYKPVESDTNTLPDL